MDYKIYKQYFGMGELVSEPQTNKPLATETSFYLYSRLWNKSRCSI